MELSQILTSVENVLNALEVSGLKAAVQRYKDASISGDNTPVGHELAQASELYMNCAAAFNQADSKVVESLNLCSLQSPGFWFDISAPALDENLRLSALTEIHSNLEFAALHLPKLLALADSQGAVGVDSMDNTAGNPVIKVRIYDAVEKASFPDRLSRLIDGVDLIYQSCADLAGESPDGLEVMSMSGLNYRTVVFKGHPEVATATRRIIRALYQQASSSLQEENYSVDQIAEQIPFMHAVDELFRVKALSAEAANDIREGVLAGSIMLLECGVRIHGDSKAMTAEIGSVAGPGQQADHSPSELHRPTSTPEQSAMASDDELEYLILDLNAKYK